MQWLSCHQPPTYTVDSNIGVDVITDRKGSKDNGLKPNEEENLGVSTVGLQMSKQNRRQ